MNDEIKEILEQYLDSIISYPFQKKDKEYILDCITNLQQQLHQASLDIQELTEKDIWCPSWCDKLTNLQQIEQDHKETNATLMLELTNLQQELEEEKRIEEADLHKIQSLEEENDVLKKKLDRRYYKNEYERLKQENERLKEQCKEWKENHKAVCIQRDNILDNIVKDTEERIDYKSRCEKASDKLGNYRHYSTPTEEQNSENEDIVDSALNILQNGSENK